MVIPRMVATGGEGVQLAFLKNLSAADQENVKRTVHCTLQSTTSKSPTFDTKHKGWVKERLAKLCNPLSKEHRLKIAPKKRLSEGWINWIALQRLNFCRHWTLQHKISGHYERKEVDWAFSGCEWYFKESSQQQHKFLFHKFQEDSVSSAVCQQLLHRWRE